MIFVILRLFFIFLKKKWRRELEYAIYENPFKKFARNGGEN